MAILKMKRLRLLAVTTQREEVLREIQMLGSVEISETNAEDGAETALRRGGGGTAAVRQEHRLVANALELLGKYAPYKTRLLSARPEISQAELLDERELAGILEISRAAADMDEQMRRIAAEESRIRGIIESLLPWRGLEIPLEFTGTRQTAALIGAVPAAVNLAELENALLAVTEDVQIFQISEDRELKRLLIICMRAERDAALEALRGFGFSPPSFGSLTGGTGENIKASENRLSELASEKQRLSEELAALGKNRDSMKRCVDRLSVKLDRADAAERLMYTDAACILEGWIPAEAEGALGGILKKFDCAWELEDPEQETIENNEVPVKLKNNILTRPLNMVTEMYSLPAYNGIDPNPLMAPFFILFYGIMMADMGYGLIMSLGGLVVRKKMKPRGGARNFVDLLILCGISTFAWGAVTGGFFGDALVHIAGLINPDTTFTGLPALFDPMNDTLMVLLGSIALGFVHIITGMIVSFVRKAADSKILDGILDEGSWWVIFAGIALMVVGVGNIGGYPVTLLAGAAMLVVGSTRGAKGIGGKLGALLGAVYNGVTGFFGDLLSYSRLMALMLAGSVIASVFNTLGAITGNMFFFLIIFALGNGINLGLNLLGCYVHDLRLQCLEFFGKFYVDGGRPFKPLGMNTKYVYTENGRK